MEKVPISDRSRLIGFKAMLKGIDLVKEALFGILSVIN